MVSTVPIPTNARTERKPAPVRDCTHASCPGSEMPGTESFIRESPKNRTPKPTSTSPHDFVLPFLKNVKNTPTAIAGSARAATLSLKPTRATIQPVKVVPMFAPMITPTACVREKSPADTKPTTMTVVAELDWMTLVTVNPVSTPLNRLEVILASRDLRRSPATL